MPRTLIDPNDLTPLDRPKALDALGRFELIRVDRTDDGLFDAAYDLLASYFLELGELEERGALARFVESPSIDFGPGLVGHYHLIVAKEGDRLVGVRDCYVELDLERRICVAALSHSFVIQEHRRGGLAAVLRTIPIHLAREACLERFGEPIPTFVACEMEPVDPELPATVVRLLAYGRSGFSVFDPRRFPYSQPDFRDLPGAAWTAMPLLGVVRTAHAQAAPVELAEAMPRLFHGCHRTYLPRWKVDPSEAHVMAALRASPEPVPLLPLPTAPDAIGLLEPLLLGNVMPLYPPGLRGPRPHFGDPAEELARLRARWSAPPTP